MSASGGRARRATVIVPTYRRERDLARCIESLGLQSRTDFEVIVVDNAVDDAVRRMVTGRTGSYPVPLRYVPECHLGLHHARHTGARAAASDLLLYTDDDATFDAGWVDAHIRAFDANPDMAAAGGPVRPVWDVPPPAWLAEYAGDFGTFAELSLLDRGRSFNKGQEVFYGVNMALRREALVRCGGFNPDAFGAVWLGDGETGLMRTLWRTGQAVGYVPDAVVLHHVPRERMTVAFLRQRMANEGAMEVYARYRGRVPRRWRLVRHALGVAARNARRWAAALVRRGMDPASLHLRLHAARTQAVFWATLRLAWATPLRELVMRTNWWECASPGANGEACDEGGT